MARYKQELASQSSQLECRVAKLLLQAQAHDAVAATLRSELQMLRHDADLHHMALEAAETSMRSAAQRCVRSLTRSGGMLS